MKPKQDSVTIKEICAHGKICEMTFYRRWKKWGLHKMILNGKRKPREFDRIGVNAALLHERVFTVPI